MYNWQLEYETQATNCNKVAEEVFDLERQLEQRKAHYFRVRARRDDAKWHLDHPERANGGHAA
jgi:hypothetical protein